MKKLFLFTIILLAGAALAAMDSSEKSKQRIYRDCLREPLSGK